MFAPGGANNFAPGAGGVFLSDETKIMTIRQLEEKVRTREALILKLQGKLGNTHICSRYVPQWGLKEGIRELIQNFNDACLKYCQKLGFDTEHIQVRHQLCCAQNGVAYRNFWVYTNQPGPPTLLGIIQYNPERQLLTIKNPGFIPKGCLLLGGGNKEDDPKCAGKFGEGLKLAILALLRLPRAQPPAAASATPATSATAATATPPPPPAHLGRQSSGEPVTQADVTMHPPPLVATDFGGRPKRADATKMTVKYITPVTEDGDKFEKLDFWLQEAAGFPAKDGKAERCMFFESTDIAADTGVTVQVSGVGVADWNKQIRFYRRFTDQTKWAIHHGKWPDKTLWTNDAGQQAIQDDHQGSVMLHRDQAGMIYVKGIHVKNGSAPVGFDFDNLSLDRDRNTVTDFYGQCRRTSYMIIGILNRIDEIKDRYQHLAGPAFQPGGGGRAALDRLWDVAYNMIITEHMRYAHEIVKQRVADRFFRMWQQKINEPEGVRADGGAYTMPVKHGVRDQASTFFQGKGMSLDVQNRVYPMRTVDWRMGNLLKKSQYYKTPQQVYATLAGNFPGDSPAVVAKKRELERVLQDLRQMAAN